jgi:Na+/melibiose symporter-like transporter
MSIPLATLANLFGKKIVILSGNLALVASSLVFFLMPNDEMGTWLVILPYCIVFGIGRGVWVRTCIFL